MSQILGPLLSIESGTSQFRSPAAIFRRLLLTLLSHPPFFVTLPYNDKIPAVDALRDSLRFFPLPVAIGLTQSLHCRFRGFF